MTEEETAEDKRIRDLNASSYYKIKHSTMPLVNSSTWVDPRFDETYSLSEEPIKYIRLDSIVITK